MGTKQHPTHGQRRRYGGVTGVRVRKPGQRKYVVVPRASERVSKPSNTSFECGQTEPFPTKLLPGQFKVQMPRNKIRHVATA